MAKKTSSIEESVEQWAKEQLKGVKFYPKANFINPQIEKTLKAIHQSQEKKVATI